MGSRAGMVSCQGNLVVIRQLITVERVKRRRVALPRVCGSTSRTLLNQQRHGTRQFSSRNSALTRSYGKNYKFTWSVHERIIDSSISFARSTRLNPSSRDGIFFLFSLLLIIPFVCGFIELGNPFKISSIFCFCRYNNWIVGSCDWWFLTNQKMKWNNIYTLCISCGFL